MVFEDMSTPRSATESSRFPAVAPLQDRILAAFFDIMIFSPSFSLVLSPLLRKIEYRYYTAPGSFEFFVLIVLAVVAHAVIGILLQTYCLKRWQATPGMMFFKLRLVDVSAMPGKLGASQALVRSALWMLSWFFLGIPFVEVLGQKQRRGLYDRAAETMVTTLKESTNEVPHPLETQFVRNLLFAFGSAVSLGIGIFAIQIYLAAEHGNFKKAELEDSDYLCSAVTHSTRSDEQRLDTATAQFLTGEVDEDCLWDEAEFALWTTDPAQRSWAYLGKSFYTKYDQQRSQRYLGLVCPADDGGEACKIAKALQQKNKYELLKTGPSLTANYLQIQELNRQGRFAEALQKVQQMAKEHRGFEKFAQKQTVKLLWAMQKSEQSEGAFAASYPFMDAENQVDLAAWMCLEQADQTCEKRIHPACGQLKDALNRGHYRNITSEAVISLVQENECKHSHEPLLVSLRAALDDDSELQDLVLAISSDSGWSHEHRLSVLRSLSFKKENSELIRKRALLTLLKKSNEIDDLAKASQTILDLDQHDHSWEKLVALYETKANQQPNSNLTKHLQKSTSSERLPANEESP